MFKITKKGWLITDSGLYNLNEVIKISSEIVKKTHSDYYITIEYISVMVYELGFPTEQEAQECLKAIIEYIEQGFSTYYE